MPVSPAVAGFEEGEVRCSILSSWMECVAGIVYVVGTGGMHMPAGHEIVVGMSANVAREPLTFLHTFEAVWTSLQAIGVPLPAYESRKIQQVLQYNGARLNDGWMKLD